MSNQSAWTFGQLGRHPNKNRLYRTYVFQICELYSSPPVSLKGLNQVVGLTVIYIYSQVEPKIWPRPFVNSPYSSDFSGKRK